MRSFLLTFAALSAAALHAEPVSLFDGKSLEGWDFDPKIWRVEDGVITGGSTTEKIRENHFICTKKSYQNFELKLKIKCSGDPKTGMLNSGIQIRSVRVPGGAHMSGYQVDCGAGWFGKIYDEFRRNKVIATPLDPAALDKAVDVFGWNEYRIRAEGPRIQVWINGVAAIDYTEADPNVALDGQLGPQVHSGGVCLVQVKDVTVEELPPTGGAPTWQSLGGVEAARKLVAPPPKPQANAAKPKRDISYNNVQGTALSAAEQLKKFHLPEGYEIELVVQESEGLGKFVSVYFDQRGRMWTQTALEYPVDANENPAAAEAVYAGKGKDKVLVYPRESLNGKIPEGGLTNATVFADGLAIPLGILPWGNGDTCYVQHGHDLKLYKDTNADGKADTFDVVLTGFGVQDSHLFPHQFTRAPGGWIWMAQGLFNNSQVHKPGSKEVVDWPKCSMARMRPDGSDFEVISTGPNNIWGLVITGEGETFIQEANDYGYPVMPFHDYAYYPGGMEALKKSYQPDFPPTAEFRMGGTGLSGLALVEGGSLKDKKAAYTMAVANPITSKVQTIAMHREGSHWKLEQVPDLITCDDPFFRPVALTNGPDGCIYIVDWYNKIISHNEVPRAHPDRDKTRGRIWRVRPAGERREIPDMSQLRVDDMLDVLESPVAWAQDVATWVLADSKALHLLDSISTLVNDDNKSAATRIHALWAWEQLGGGNPGVLARMLGDANPAIRREAARAVGSFASSLGHDKALELLAGLVNDPEPDVRRAAINSLGGPKQPGKQVLSALLAFARPALSGPVGPSSRANKQILVREAYDREFERFLVRMHLERHPASVAELLDSPGAEKLTVESLVIASLALDPKASASRVAKLLPKLDRAPNDEELLRLAQFPNEPGVGESLKALLANEKSRTAVAEKLLAQRTKLDASSLAPLLTEAAEQMLAKEPANLLALQLISGFQLTALEPELVDTLGVEVDPAAQAKNEPTHQPIKVLNTLRDLRSGQSELFEKIIRSSLTKPAVQSAAVEALAASSAADAGSRLLSLYSSLPPGQRRGALNTLSSSKAGAKAIVTALLEKKLPQGELDGQVVERLAIVLEDDPAVARLQEMLGGVFQEVLLLDGQDTAWVDSKITLTGPFTVEAWVRLDPGISNEDSLLGSPGKIDLNFFQSKFRVWIGEKGLHDVCASTKPMTPELWTHLAVTRDAEGVFRIYQNGELDATSVKTTTADFENCKIGWSGPKKGTAGAMTEVRVWKGARSAAQIRACFDRVLPSAGMDCQKPLAALHAAPPAPSAKNPPRSPLPVGKGARLAKTLDTPPLLTEDQARALDAKFEKFTALAPKGNAVQGKMLSALCLSCHQIGNAGGQIGPNLSGAGAMGLEAVLRNILTPNAAMEPGYRIYRLEMVNGDLVDAFYVNEDKDAVVIRQAGLPDRRVEKTKIRSAKFIRRSLMPEGLLDALPDQSVADLLAYLMTLKG